MKWILTSVFAVAFIAFCFMAFLSLADPEGRGGKIGLLFLSGAGVCVVILVTILIRL